MKNLKLSINSWAIVLVIFLVAIRLTQPDWLYSLPVTSVQAMLFLGLLFAAYAIYLYRDFVASSYEGRERALCLAHLIVFIMLGVISIGYAIYKSSV